MTDEDRELAVLLGWRDIQWKDECQTCHGSGKVPSKPYAGGQEIQPRGRCSACHGSGDRTRPWVDPWALAGIVGRMAKALDFDADQPGHVLVTLARAFRERYDALARRVVRLEERIAELQGMVDR
jgi:hypothetical protein